MKTKVKLETEKEVTVDELTDESHVGFISDSYGKGYVAFVGDGYFSAIYVSNIGSKCNCVRGDRMTKIKDLLLNQVGVGSKITDIYVFTTRKELYQWLAE